MTFRIGDEVLKARVSGETKIQPGDMAELTVDSSKIYIFDKDTQKAIEKEIFFVKFVQARGILACIFFLFELR